MEFWWLGAPMLAQAEQGEPAKPQPGAGGGPDMCLGPFFIPLIAIFFLYYFLILRPQRRQEQTRREMLSTLKKNDQVVTIGGIYGTVTGVKDDEVTIRVDDSTNTKLRVTRASISRIITPGGDEEKGK